MPSLPNRLLLGLVCAIALCACGQTGPLYHPGETQPPAPSYEEEEAQEEHVDIS